MKKNSLTLVSDIGGTNARIALLGSDHHIMHEKIYSHAEFKDLEEVFKTYMDEVEVPELTKAILGVAAPIIGDEINFVNANISFSQKKLKQKIFKEKLIVLNDLELQSLALNNLRKENVNFIGSKEIQDSAKILIMPGTGLGLAGLVKGTPIATEAGHMNIPSSNDELSHLIHSFEKNRGRTPTFEDLLSGRGILFLNEYISGKKIDLITSEQILNSSSEEGRRVRAIFSNLLAIFCRNSALMWGAKGGVYLSGSIVNTLMERISLEEFRLNFEDSPTMGNLLKACPLIHVKKANLAFEGAKTLIT